MLPLGIAACPRCLTEWHVQPARPRAAQQLAACSNISLQAGWVRRTFLQACGSILVVSVSSCLYRFGKSKRSDGRSIVLPFCSNVPTPFESRSTTVRM